MKKIAILIASLALTSAWANADMAHQHAVAKLEKV
jgi:hypothetical protein